MTLFVLDTDFHPTLLTLLGRHGLTVASRQNIFKKYYSACDKITLHHPLSKIYFAIISTQVEIEELHTLLDSLNLSNLTKQYGRR